MTVEYHLERFVTAQQTHYPRALQEIKSGRKLSSCLQARIRGC